MGRRWHLVAPLLVVALPACGRTPVAWFEAFDAPRCGERAEDGFAQVVVGYEPTAGGGAWPLRDDVIDPEAALGPPDHQPTPPLGTVSIGDGGTLTIGFEPCVMATSGSPAADLVVYEAGFDERVVVELRPTPATRDQLGDRVGRDGYVRLSTAPDREGAIDVDAELGGAGLQFDAVRIRDVAGQGLETVNTPGADIDALEAMVVANE
ncbi:hypothetical protein [Paraliomyxa miuraensis]|uniref:hypothetical protein n=1 Tax=Paraliomyxa miuraensis TaxID=376150 RepID=UPI00224CA99A|nr:hypothetical protein [Paraliomyxa miuraensis]MCX4245575.1 hypothetical protein [Paraliomyxa miuraensis]